MNTYAKRRQKLLKDIEGNCAVVLFSGNAINKSEDECYPFDVNRNFYYLTGLENESMMLLVSRINGIYNEELFILPYDELLAKWVGGRMSAKDAGRISGIQRVSDCSAFDETIAHLLNRTRRDPEFGLYFDLWHYSTDQPLTPALKFVN
ncbi:MAG: aminopeptidase P N-terminal domain-containing protein, partial [Erysipelotrichaceae bacterium]|nr:aminopeptidase P N-terminal domain-containing protein [Erysipelotrichaceae bacterium]